MTNEKIADFQQQNCDTVEEYIANVQKEGHLEALATELFQYAQKLDGVMAYCHFLVSRGNEESALSMFIEAAGYHKGDFFEIYTKYS